MDKTKRPNSLISRQQESRLVPVQISYTQKNASVLLTVNVKHGTTVREAYALSCIESIISDTRLEEGKVFLDGEPKTLDTVLKKNDCIEIYRELPKKIKKMRENEVNKSPKAQKAKKKSA